MLFRSSLSLFLSFSLVLSAHSPSRLTLRDQHHDCRTKKSIDQHHTTAADQHHTTIADQHQTTRRRSLSPQSPFFSFDQDQTIVADELADQDQTTTADQHQTTATCRQSLSPQSPFSHFIKIKPLSSMNSLIKIKALPPINIKPLPHKA